MSWLDDIINGIWDLVFGSELEALQGIYDFIKNLPQTVAEFLAALMILATYPFICILEVIRDTFNHMWGIFTGFFNLPIDFANLGYNLVNIALPSFPPIWIWILFLILSIRISIIIVRWIWSIIP